MKAENVELQVEELVLRGFAPGERHRIGEGVERELVRLIDEQGVPPSLAQGGEFAHLDGGAFEVSHGSKSKTVGVQVAQAIYGKLS
jgi:hypothetical protein